MSEEFPQRSHRKEEHSKSASIRNSHLRANTFLYPIDESEDFYDPFSDLSLFLANKIKKEIVNENNPKQWSKKIQDVLLKQILPEFTNKFPRYRLGVTALKKSWEKVRYYLDSVDEKKGALQSDGSLNIAFLIQENLKQIPFKKNIDNIHPYTLAHQIAIKISECVATLDGVRVGLEEMTKIVWSIQKHLIATKEDRSTCPLEKYDAIDKLIVRFQLEEIAKEPGISQKDLCQNIQKKLTRLSQFCRIKNIHDLSPGLFALLAENMYPYLTIHSRLNKQKLERITGFIRKQCREYLKRETPEKEADRMHFVRRILFLYRLSAKMPKETAERQLEAAISYVLSLSSDRIQTEIPVLRPEVYAFIQYEIGLIKKHRDQQPLQTVLQTLVDTFEEAKKNPILDDQEYADLEIIVWKVLHEESNLLAKIPYYLREILEEELVNVHIENPKSSFQTIVHRTLESLKNIRDLPLNNIQSVNPFAPAEIADKAIYQKIYNWSLQNDLIVGWIHFDPNTYICKTIRKLWKEQRLDESHISHSEFIDKVVHKIIHDHPTFKNYKKPLHDRATILYKHFWYNDLRGEDETTFDRLVKWHYVSLINEEQMQFSEMIVERIREFCSESLPFTPFNREYVRDQTSALADCV